MGFCSRKAGFNVGTVAEGLNSGAACFGNKAVRFWIGAVGFGTKAEGFGK